MTLIGGVLVAVLCLVFAVLLLLGIHRLATEYLTEQVAAAGSRTAYSIEKGALRDPIQGTHDRDVQVVDHQGKVVMATKNLRGAPPMANFGARNVLQPAVSVVCDRVFGASNCDIVAAVPVYYQGQSWTVYSAAPVIPLYVHPWLAVLVFGGSLLLVVAITYIGYQLLGRVLLPVQAIRTELDEIEAADLSRRVPVPLGRDEIHDLAVSVNHTLTRLEAAMEQHRRFTSDASHELRTPITAMRTQVEDALCAAHDTDVAAVARSLLPSLDRLQDIVTDLLTLSRLEAGASLRREPVDLAELVTSELGRRPPLRGAGETKEIVCELAAGVVARGDKLELSRLMTNLVDNAERHAERTIVITVGRRPGDPRDPRFATGAAVLEVADDGAGIPPGQRELVFQRFARLDTARSRDAGGTGLGLPIARQIAESHGGSLMIENGRPGARFVLRLPLAVPTTGADA
ncbi:HAMP domain-containing histidine kinase [Planotetraspora sp. A-T 1434]|uniref:sensor histidine kinase n=1 Tax=Planotetraspora sp. A-T 1434 TaxID=2979219 RepID=UPI0021BEBD2B|nr:HAMP domain-containing sensor histidine kinase [Planotetraspora sp. A-T 1434]MCT9932271.1 HAMP domain-containing histidine kinase [Planotetraspora sp. A-T 1434]